MPTAYQPKVYRKQGGNDLMLKPGGTIQSEGGAVIHRDRLDLDIADSGVDTSYFLVVPYACKVTKAWIVIDGVVATADLLVQMKIGGVNVTNGLLTSPLAGTAVGRVDSCTPTAANVLTAGQALEFAVSGNGAAGGRAHIVVEIEFTA